MGRPHRRDSRLWPGPTSEKLCAFGLVTAPLHAPVSTSEELGTYSSLTHLRLKNFENTILITDFAGLEWLSDLPPVLSTPPDQKPGAGAGAWACLRHTASLCQNWARCPGVLNLRSRCPHQPGQHCHVSSGGLGQLHPRGILVTKRVVGRMWHIRPHQYQGGPVVPPSLAAWGRNLSCFKSESHLPLQVPLVLHAFCDCAAHGTPPFVAFCGQIFMSMCPYFVHICVSGTQVG